MDASVQVHNIQIYPLSFGEHLRPKDKPWVTLETRRLLHKRYGLCKRFRRTSAHYQVYKKIRNAVVTLNRKNIRNYVNCIDSHLGECADPKKWWSNFKTLLSNKSHQSVYPILYEDRVITNDKDKAEIFNIIFSEQCSVPVVKPTHTLPPFTCSTAALCIGSNLGLKFGRERPIRVLLPHLAEPKIYQ